MEKAFIQPGHDLRCYRPSALPAGGKAARCPRGSNLLYRRLNTPMAMIMFGTYLANTDLKTMFREKKIYLAAALKLLVLPALMLLIFRLCGVTGALLTSCIISASAPTANNTVMFAAKYGRDTGLSSKVVAVITFLSILTMPLMIALSQTI